MRADQLDPSFASQPIIQRVAVIGSIADQAFGIVGKEAMIEGVLDEGDLMWRSVGGQAVVAAHLPLNIRKIQGKPQTWGVPPSVDGVRNPTGERQSTALGDSGHF